MPFYKKDDLTMESTQITLQLGLPDKIQDAK